jgi:hypothetical protein
MARSSKENLKLKEELKEVIKKNELPFKSSKFVPNETFLHPMTRIHMKSENFNEKVMRMKGNLPINF